MGEPKYTNWILETIDQLRKRKARPDRDRICHMVERKHKLTFAETSAELERLVDAEIVIKVDYKGSTSYRNAAKWKKSLLGGHLINSTEANSTVEKALRLLTCGFGDQTGASVREIEKWIQARTPLKWLNTGIDSQKTPTSPLIAVLRRGVDGGRFKKLLNGNYILSEPKKSSGKGKGAACQKARLQHAQNLKKTAAQAKKGKTAFGAKTKLSHRKKNKIPDEEYETYEQEMVVEYRVDEKCDYCLQTAECNRGGEAEDLLVCKDCNAKAHPSCMDYSDELAVRAQSSPWQCMDCKTCYICNDSGDAADMLFCDACDKGYHMKCHKPEISNKPTGKWVCNRCVLEGCTVGDEAMDTSGNVGDPINADGGGPSCLPTPCDSPVQFTSTEQKVKTEIGATCDGKKQEIVKPVPVNPALPAYMNQDPADWSIDNVAGYFSLKGFSDQAENFREQEIDGRSLMLMKRNDVLTGLSMKLGPALKINELVTKLQSEGGMPV